VKRVPQNFNDIDIFELLAGKSAPDGIINDNEVNNFLNELGGG
jgi:hypothetical protein